MMTSNLLLQFEQAQAKEQQLHKIFRGSLLGKLRYYPWQALTTKILFKFFPWLQNNWVVKNTLFTGQAFYTEGYFMDYYLCGIIGEEIENALTLWLLKNYQESEVFFDVGAHYGFYSVVAEAISKGKSKIFAFEPTPNVRSILLKNTAQYSAIKVVGKAVSDIDGTKTFNIYNSHGQYLSNSFYPEADSSGPSNAKQTTPLVVETVSLDSFCKTSGLQPSLIKLDVENSELDVLMGSQVVLQTCRPKLIVEIWPKHNNLRHREAVRMLIKLDYKLYRINSDGDLIAIPEAESWLASLGHTENLVALP